jgi:hypothetical protein
MPEQHLVLEEDGTSALLAENGTDAILIEEVVQQGVGAGSYSVDGHAVTALPVILPPPVEPFVSRGSLGSASEYDFSDYYLDLSPSSDVPAGEIVLVYVAWSSHYFFGPDGEELSECYCGDSVGNHYMQLFGGYMPSHIDSTFAAIFMGQLHHRLNTTDTITVKHFGPGAKAVSLWQVGIREDQRWALMRDQLVAAGSVAGSGLYDPSAMTISGLSADEHYLICHVLASMGPPSDPYTWDSDYEQIDTAGTSGHGTGSGAPPTSDQSVLGGLRVVSGITSDTIDVTNTGTARQWGQAVVAVVALTTDEDFFEFPNTPLIDDFNRANEDPNDGSGKWDHTGGRPGFGTAYTRVVSNKAGMSSSGTGSGSEFTTASITSDDGLGESEVWGTIDTAGDAVLYLLATGAGSSANLASLGVGYRDGGQRAMNQDTRGIVALVGWGPLGFGGDIPADDAAILWGKFASSFKVGLQQLAYWTQHLFIDDGEGWLWVAAIRKTDSGSFRADGKFGIGFEGDVATRLDDFGGGALHRDIGQIIRRWPPRG